ncbi:Uncharacterised protein [Mycobacteroides abscessus]|nr:Uncharacterised protein [Mycobacteroides abscessus]
MNTGRDSAAVDGAGATTAAPRTGTASPLERRSSIGASGRSSSSPTTRSLKMLDRRDGGGPAATACAGASGCCSLAFSAAPTIDATTGPGSRTQVGSQTLSTRDHPMRPVRTEVGRPSRSPTLVRSAQTGPSSMTAIQARSAAARTARSTVKSERPTPVRTSSPATRSALPTSSR